MKALVIREDRFGVESVPVPDPGPGEVLVKVAYSGICRTDLYVIEKSLKAKLPIVPGHEFSGEVVRGGEFFKEGAKVAINPILPCRVCVSCQQSKPSRCLHSQMLGVHRDGSFAEYISVPESSVFQVDNETGLISMAYAEPVAACLAVDISEINPSMYGAVAGNNRISVLTQKLLAQRGFNNLELNIDGENRFDFIIETKADGEVIAKSINALKPGGVLIVKSRSNQSVPVNFNELIRKELSFKAVNYADFSHSIEALENGLDLSDLIGPKFSLEDYEEAFSLAKESETKKIFFEMG